MKTKFLLVMATLSLIVVTPIWGQEVIWDESRPEGARLVIDNTGLPVAALYDRGRSVPTDPNPPNADTPSPVNRVARKIVVSLVNINGTSIGNSGGVGAAPCPAGWRIPNQRELMLIWLLRASLYQVAADNGATIQGFVYGFYGSSSRTATYLHCVSFNINSSGHDGRVVGFLYTNPDSKSYTRCVQSY